jgi:hypothetical protein
MTAACHCCLQDLHGGVLLKISTAAEDDFVRLNLLWTGFFGETCEPDALSYMLLSHVSYRNTCSYKAASSVSSLSLTDSVMDQDVKKFKPLVTTGIS